MPKNMNRIGLLSGAASLAAIAVSTGFATPALAQSHAASGLDVIIVTAQKREQNVQDVPIAVTALTTDALEANRVTNVSDLSALAPGLTVSQAVGGALLPSFSMRGAVSLGVTPGTDKQISTYLDGVYLSAARGAMFNLPNLAAIEVPRGPQGTLFGRNATAGAVSIRSAPIPHPVPTSVGTTSSTVDPGRPRTAAHPTAPRISSASEPSGSRDLSRVAATAATVMTASTTITDRKSLSAVPKVWMAHSFTGPGVRSMTTAPTAARASLAAETSADTNWVTPRATTAPATPAEALPVPVEAGGGRSDIAAKLPPPAAGVNDEIKPEPLH